MKNDTELHYKRLSKMHPEIAEWLDDAQRNGENVLYISLGHEINW
jgi:hypothetical protein